MKAITVLLLFFLVWTTGCAVIGSTEHKSFVSQGVGIPFDANASETSPHGSFALANGLASIDREVLQLEIDRTPVGSYVHVTVLDQSFQGTLLRKEPKKLALVNSMSTEVMVDCDGRKYARKSHTPFQVVETSQVGGFSILAPPSDKFAPRGMRYQADCLTVDAFEFHSGRIQRWFEPSTDAAISRQNCSPVELERKLAEILAGSQVALLDGSGQAYNAIVSGMGHGGLKLLNCMTQETVPGPDGRRQLRTSNVPWQTIPIQSISSCTVVESPHSEFAPIDEDDHCDQCVSDIIYKSGRRQSAWKSAQDEREVERILTGRPKWLAFATMLRSSADD